MLKVLIVIQARSTSKRLPNKSFALIGNKPMLQYVVDNVKKSMLYLNAYSNKNGFVISGCIATPIGDPIAHYDWGLQVIEGPEDDVLTRFNLAVKEHNPDYIVRITGDCPLLPPELITKHIRTAVKNGFDYVSNVDEETRTSCDGHDVEVISRALFKYVNENATDPGFREHVTLYIRMTQLPPNFKVGCIFNFLDYSDFKISVDTVEDFNRVVNIFESISSKIEKAKEKYGSACIHRFSIE